MWARPDAGDILAGVRGGRMFAVTGDLIDRLELTVQAVDGSSSVGRMGDAVQLVPGTPMRVQLRVRQPSAANAAGQHPRLRQLQLIVGSGPAQAPQMQTRRFTATDWKQDGAWYQVAWELPAPANGGFVRARGSNTDEPTPLEDVKGEDPWQDLWFHSNPVFITR